MGKESFFIRCHAIGEAKGIAIGEAKGVDKARLESIKTVMKKLKYDVQQAMDFLDVPVNDQAKYAAKISG